MDDAATGNVKATREDWLEAALDTLVMDGIEQVKIMPLATRLAVSRSSFYWYFKSRQDLLDALLDTWQHSNTAAIVGGASRPHETITGAVCHIFLCFLDPARFNNRLDFAIRDWSRRDACVRRRLHASDADRIEALSAMFKRFDYPASEAITRARVLYYMQIGYFDADLNEPLSERQPFTSDYVLTFTGKRPSSAEVAALDRALAAVSL
jgi:AcrR family transcriptional regulator